MKLTEECPIYLNPTDGELVELVTAGFDSLRILEDEHNFVVASGYGNTHTKLARVMRARFPQFHGDVFILYESGYKLFFNLEDVNGMCEVPWRQALRYLYPNSHKYIETIANLYNQRL